MSAIATALSEVKNASLRARRTLCVIGMIVWCLALAAYLLPILFRQGNLRLNDQQTFFMGVFELVLLAWGMISTGYEDKKAPGGDFRSAWEWGYYMALGSAFMVPVLVIVGNMYNR